MHTMRTKKKQLMLDPRAPTLTDVHPLTVRCLITHSYSSVSRSSHIIFYSTNCYTGYSNHSATLSNTHLHPNCIGKEKEDGGNNTSHGDSIARLPSLVHKQRRTFHHDHLSSHFDTLLTHIPAATLDQNSCLIYLC